MLEFQIMCGHWKALRIDRTTLVKEAPSCEPPSTRMGSPPVPPARLRGEERHNRADVIGLSDPRLSRLSRERSTSLVWLGRGRPSCLSRPARRVKNADSATGRAPPRSTSPAFPTAPSGRMRSDRVPLAAKNALRVKTRSRCLLSPHGSNCCPGKRRADVDCET